MQKFILGIHGWCDHDAGAGILKHDNVKILDIVAIAEERLVRGSFFCGMFRVDI